MSLAYNHIWMAEAGAFGKSLEHIWLTGNNLTCSVIEGVDGALPSGAGCTDEGECSARGGVSWIGDGFCDEPFDSRYNTAGCLWDGGDCR